MGDDCCVRGVAIIGSAAIGVGVVAMELIRALVLSGVTGCCTSDFGRAMCDAARARE